MSDCDSLISNLDNSKICKVSLAIVLCIEKINKIKKNKLIL